MALPLETAKNMADYLVDQLKPFCDRIEIAGSIRRRKEFVKDIEIVCIPKKQPITDLFQTITGYQVVDGFRNTVALHERVKGHPEGKYTQRIVKLENLESKEVYECKLDLFMCTPDNWGVIFLIRTGPWEFSKKVAGTLAPAEGYKVEDGVLWRGKSAIKVPEEADFFRILNRRYMEPWDRF